MQLIRTIACSVAVAECFTFFVIAKATW